MALEVRPGPKLAERTTLRLGGATLAEVALTAPADAESLPAALRELGGRPFVLGGGSNILAHDGILPLVLVAPRITGEPEILRERFAGKVRARVGAGVKLHRFTAWLATQGLDALSGLFGVPGTVGGAVAGNAGSYGSETGQSLARIQVWTPQDGLHWRERDGFTYGYRRFAITGDPSFFLVLAAEFDCDIDEPIAIRRRMIDHMRQKRACQPITAASAGCVFKNPAGTSAGRLLEAAGFRGKRLGGMAFSPVHANFLVNEGAGTATEAFSLIAQARDAVKRHSGHELELEVRVAP